MDQRSSIRARLLFIAGPAAAIVWSVYAAILTADARQHAADADAAWRHQWARVESTRRRSARVKAELRLAVKRGAAEGMALAAGTGATLMDGPAGLATAAGAETVSVIAAGAGGDGPAGGIAAATPGAAPAPAASPEAAAPVASGLAGADAAAPVRAPGRGDAAAGLAPVNGAAVVGDAGMAAVSAAIAADTGAGDAAGLQAGSNVAGIPGADTPEPAGSLPRAIPVPPEKPVAKAAEPVARGPAVADPKDSIAIARAAAAERAGLISGLRERIEGLEVQVDEICLGSAHEDAGEWVRSVRIQLSGKKDTVKKAVGRLKGAPAVREMAGGKLESVRAAKGEARITLTGTMRAAAPAARG